MKDPDPPEDETSSEAPEPAKRTDVGYKRPPREYQFKKDEKPPPRKKKVTPGAVSMIETLRKVLNEKRRVTVGDKVRWIPNVILVMTRAWQEAEKKSVTLRRELLRLSLSFEAPSLELAPLVVTDRSAPASSTEFRLMPIDEGDS